MQRGFVMVDERNDASHRTFQPNVPDQSARVDSGNDGNAVFGEVVIERLRRAPVAGQRRQPLHNERFEERLARFDVFRINAGIADQRIRHRDDLAGVRRIGQNLLITRHRRIENDFANGFAFKAVSVATKNTPVFEQQRCASFQSRDPILFIGQYRKTALP